jgi:hypothetical protein
LRCSRTAERNGSSRPAICGEIVEKTYSNRFDLFDRACRR